MIDPTRVSSHGRSPAELEEVLLFWVCAAGKNGKTAARCLDAFLGAWDFGTPSPFQAVKNAHRAASLPAELKKSGIGCYSAKAKTFLALALSGLDLAACSLDDLEAVPLGPKTARCFLLHSRDGQALAGLDTHVLRFLRDAGFDAPRSTPGKKKYRELEREFLGLAARSGLTPSDLDLRVWNAYSGAGGSPADVLALVGVTGPGAASSR